MNLNEAKKLMRYFSFDVVAEIEKYCDCSFDDLNIYIKFSTMMEKRIGICQHIKSKQRVNLKYSLKWIKENLDNPGQLKSLCVHEVCHILHPNHKKHFHFLRERMCLKFDLPIDDCRESKTVPGRYKAVCKDCGLVHHRYYRSKKDWCCACIKVYNPSKILIFTKPNEEAKKEWSEC